MQGFLTLHDNPEHPFHAATKDYVDLSEPQEAPHNGKLYARQDGQWVEIEEQQAPMEEPPASPVALWVRSSAGARGWIELPDASQSIEEPRRPCSDLGSLIGGRARLAGNPDLRPSRRLREQDRRHHDRASSRLMAHR